ncbi:MobA/MobL family protein [Nostoc linckia]|uniref:MobA/MobL family protein n=1 Tax=Nostoc linckia TaxID=92942 RepID=UPI000BFFBAE8|nr:MobA/MobL family protein [Nostoc linckia]
MAIYHCHIEVIGKASSKKAGQPRHALAFSAYRSGEDYSNEIQGIIGLDKTGDRAQAAAAYRSAGRVSKKQKIGNFSNRRQEVLHTEIMAPGHAPEWALKRKELWKAVDKKERRIDAQLCREVLVALPRELTIEQSTDALREYIQKNFVSRGMVADFAIHRGDDKRKKKRKPETKAEKIKQEILHNPHCHILLTMRHLTPTGFGNKNRDWNKRELVPEWRESWAVVLNKHLKMAGSQARVDHRSLKDRGIDRKPNLHVGVKDWNLKHLHGIETVQYKKYSDRLEENRRWEAEQSKKQRPDYPRYQERPGQQKREAQNKQVEREPSLAGTAPQKAKDGNFKPITPNFDPRKIPHGRPHREIFDYDTKVSHRMILARRLVTLLKVKERRIYLRHLAIIERQKIAEEIGKRRDKRQAKEERREQKKKDKETAKMQRIRAGTAGRANLDTRRVTPDKYGLASAELDKTIELAGHLDKGNLNEITPHQQYRSQFHQHMSKLTPRPLVDAFVHNKPEAVNLDKKVAAKMYAFGYQPHEIKNAILKGSPSLAGKSGKEKRAYIKNNIDPIFKNREVRKRREAMDKWRDVNGIPPNIRRIECIEAFHARQNQYERPSPNPSRHH